jgi:hypothetical protein
MATTREQAADEWVVQQLAQAPPLSQRQRAKLAELLRPVRINAATRSSRHQVAS